MESRYFEKFAFEYFFTLIFSILLFFLNFVNIFSNIPCWTFSHKNPPYYLYEIVGDMNKLFQLTAKIFLSKNNFLPFKVHIVYMYFSTGWIYTEFQLFFFTRNFYKKNKTTTQTKHSKQRNHTTFHKHTTSSKHFTRPCIINSISHPFHNHHNFRRHSILPLPKTLLFFFTIITNIEHSINLFQFFSPYLHRSKIKACFPNY